MRVELRNSCNVRDYRDVHELIEKAAEQESGLEEERRQNQTSQNRGECRAGACYNYGERGHMAWECPKEKRAHRRCCYRCGQEGHLSWDCPTLQGENAGGAQPQQQRGQAARPRAYAVEGRDGAEPVAGSVAVGGVMAFTLFDTGETHSFVSPKLTREWNFKGKFNTMVTGVETTGTEKMATRGRYEEVPVILAGVNLPGDLLELELGRYEVILGMDWLAQHKVVVECAKECVRIPLDGRQIVVELRNSCNVRDYRDVHELIEKAAEQESGLEEERRQNQTSQNRGAKRPRDALPAAEPAPARPPCERRCYRCGQEGHLSWDRPTLQGENAGGAQPQQQREQAARPRAYAVEGREGAEPIAGSVAVGGVMAFTLFDTRVTHSFGSPKLTREWNFKGNFNTMVTGAETAGTEKMATRGRYEEKAAEQESGLEEERRQNQTSKNRGAKRPRDALPAAEPAPARPPCERCGRYHVGECRAGACYNYGERGHMARECPKDICRGIAQHYKERMREGRNPNSREDKPQGQERTPSRVAKEPNQSRCCVGSVAVGGVMAFTLFDTGVTHSFVSPKLTREWNFKGHFNTMVTGAQTAGTEKMATRGRYEEVPVILAGVNLLGDLQEHIAGNGLASTAQSCSRVCQGVR
ncbi:hypothetical protein F2Q69_00044264 [Brassica cretica]|uniref:CCHC-type domain-containing protein n=1 Tax=Brassica cretica TaxID=69181 RepID=A0A8S9N812_BRACR|nr:hypothetical protein F2Q69_00044264 [Brassica cretica]